MSAALPSLPWTPKVSTYLWILFAMIALIVGANLLFTLYLEYEGVFAGAEYESGVAFSGTSHFGRTTYDAVRWYPDPRDPQPCPIQIHVPDGDLGAAELSDRAVLLARGWEELLKNEATTPELETQLRALKQAVRPVHDDDLPRVYQRWQGNLLLSVTFGDGGLRAVWVGRGPLRTLEHHEGIVSIDGKRLSLPISDVDADRILGDPRGRLRVDK